MSSTDETIKESLEKLGLADQELEEAAEIILLLREELADSMAMFSEKSAPRALAIANNIQAIQVIDALVDNIVQKLGVLELAMQGEDIHDILAVLKAKIEALVTEEEVEASTIEHKTQRLFKLRRKDFREGEG